MCLQEGEALPAAAPQANGDHAITNRASVASSTAGDGHHGSALPDASVELEEDIQRALIAGVWAIS